MLLQRMRSTAQKIIEDLLRLLPHEAMSLARSIQQDPHERNVHCGFGRERAKNNPATTLPMADVLGIARVARSAEARKILGSLTNKDGP